MHNEIDTQRLIGQELSSVSVSKNNIRLHFVRYPFSTVSAKFKDSAEIDIENGYEIISTSGHSVTAVQKDGDGVLHINAGVFLPFIERAIVSAKLTDTEDLDLIFDNGIGARILASNIGFEAYHVRMQSES
jgi:hypothetical protein